MGVAKDVKRKVGRLRVSKTVSVQAGEKQNYKTFTAREKYKQGEQSRGEKKPTPP